ncbi:MAG: TolC family protein [Chitinophagales bacterium]|nr:TolC family protein [Chitinophagales bacterium]
MNIKRFFWLSVGALTSTVVFAQTEILQLEEAIMAAHANNKNIEKAEKDIEIANTQYKKSTAIFLPQVGLSYTAMTTNNPLNAFGFKLQQGSITQNDFNPALLNNPDNTGDFMTQAKLEQPIFNADMLYKRKAAKAQIEIKGLQKDRIKDYIQMLTENEFMQLQFTYEAVDVIKEALETANALYKRTNDFYEQGYVQKSDMLNVGVHIKAIETQLKSTENMIENSSDQLSVLMGKPTGTIYQVEELQALIPLEVVSIPDNRSDFKAMEKGMAAYDLMKKSSKMSFVPKLNGFASYQFNDAKFGRFRARSYLAGLQLSWNVFQGNTQKHEIAENQLEREKLEIDLENMKTESEKELLKAQRTLIDADFQIKQALKAIEQSEEALNITQARYEQGLENITNVLMAQTQLSQQRLSLKQAVLIKHDTCLYPIFNCK